jgi:succinate dehydrogenase / fumarate reductase iron-sulfur subunit
MAEYTLKLRRYNPESGEAPFWEEFQVELEPHRSVLEGILKVKAEVDGSIGIRCSCRAAICGSCGVRINGRAGLACHTHLGHAADSGVHADGRTITVEPMGNMPILKDLIVDMDAVHWKKIQRVTPWLINKEPVPEREYIVPHENMVDVTQTMACIQCGACVSDCLSMEVDPLFVGPAASARAYRFVGDPRDAEQYERVKDLAEDRHGIYDCTHCFNCIEACPKGVAPMSQIMRLRRVATADFHIEDRNNGHRHEQAFVTLVKEGGLLHEAELLPRSYGGDSWFGKFHPAAGQELLSSLPVITKALLRGKVTPRGALAPHKLPKDALRAVQAITEKVERRHPRNELNLYITGYDDGPGDGEGDGDRDGEAHAIGAADGMPSAPGPNPHRPTSASESESA